MSSKVDISTDKNQDLQITVQELYKKYGPLCDSEGFYNHYNGTCWIDSIQMVILFSDTIKSVVQAELINEEITQEKVEERCSKQISSELKAAYKSSGEKPDIEEYILYTVELLKALQKRLLRHYYSEYMRLETISTEEKCTFEDMRAKIAIEKLKEIGFLQRSKGKEAFESAIFAKLKYENEEDRFAIERSNDVDVPGGSDIDITGVTRILLSYFKINKDIIIEGFDYKLFHYYLTFRTKLKEDKFGKPIEVLGYYISSLKHLTCFYKCGNYQYYFDDNEGVLLFEWEKFLEVFREKLDKAKVEKLEPPTFYTGATLTYSDKSGRVYYKFENTPFLEYEENNTKYLQTTIILGNGTNKVIQFVVDPRGREKGYYTFEHTMNDSTVRLSIHPKYYTIPDSKIKIFFLLYKKKTKETEAEEQSGFNVQTGKYLGARIGFYNDDETDKAELEAFIRTLGKGGEKDINKKLNGGLPLITALGYRDINNVSKLLYYGADPNQIQNIKTPLGVAISLESYDKTNNKEIQQINTLELVKLLIKAGADINKVDKHKKLPIHYAIEEKNKLVIEYLLEKGAKIRQKNIYGHTPIQTVKNVLYSIPSENTNDKVWFTNLLNILQNRKKKEEEFNIRVRRYVPVTRKNRSSGRRKTQRH